MSERDFERFETKTLTPVVKEIVSLGKAVDLEVNNEDIHELIDEHSQELTKDELLHLQEWQH